MWTNKSTPYVDRNMYTAVWTNINFSVWHQLLRVKCTILPDVFCANCQNFINKLYNSSLYE